MDKVILLAEDDARLAASVSKSLRDEGFIVDYVADGLSAKNKLTRRKVSYCLALFDVLMPGLNGFEVCKIIRQSGIDIPVIMLTSLGSKEQIITALNLGADDYLVKPFSLPELIARVKSALRRPKLERISKFNIGPFEFFPDKYVVTVKSKPLQLRKREYALLLFLARNSGAILTREQILERVWEHGANIYPTTIDVHIRFIRKILGEYSSCIQTVHGIGYKFSAT